ncbi:nitrogen regulation protein NR(I) [Kerstersia sp.]|uniref:nitrogen regulation protein NR(I) n=1 Tax=Kerstersia sp. TaxID=1930783 RepID=UPI003F928E2E
MKSVWIVDDDQAIRWVLEKALARAGIVTRSFPGPERVLQALAQEQPDALVSDIRMPGGDGLGLLGEIKARHPALPVIVMTAYADLESTVSAFQHGAFDYLAKPFDVNDAVALIQRATQDSKRAQPALGEAATLPVDQRVMMMRSASTAMQEVFRAIGRLAQSRATVLITGESGTGKELIARALHSHGSRAAAPFVALNAAAIPRDLLEAELFGHERGAFTGASQLRRGRFEEADGGTLFLDEIGDMPLELQTRLLRVLAEGSFYRVGGSQPVKVDVRIIAATHQPLEQLVAQGRFREDLFHRLNVIRLRLPPLRERREDIPALTEHFLAQSARTLGVASKTLTHDAMHAFCRFDFPGNVRQLENFCHWLTVMAPGQMVGLEDLPPEISAARAQQAQQRVQGASMAPPVQGGQPGPASDPLAADTWHTGLRQDVRQRLARGEFDIMAVLTRQFEEILLQAALDACRGRRIEAAARLGIGRNTLTRKLKDWEETGLL